MSPEVWVAVVVIGVVVGGLLSWAIIRFDPYRRKQRAARAAEPRRPTNWVESAAQVYVWGAVGRFIGLVIALVIAAYFLWPR